MSRGGGIFTFHVGRTRPPPQPASPFPSATPSPSHHKVHSYVAAGWESQQGCERGEGWGGKESSRVASAVKDGVVACLDHHGRHSLYLLKLNSLPDYLLNYLLTEAARRAFIIIVISRRFIEGGPVTTPIKFLST